MNVVWFGLFAVCGILSVVHGAVPTNINVGSIGASAGFIVSAEATAPTASYLGRESAMLDFDGDGNMDLAIAACRMNNNSLGRVYVIYGPITTSPVLPPSSPSLGFTVDGASPAYLFGQSISGGDINGDSLDDIVIGHYDPTLGAGFFAIVWGRKERDITSLYTDTLESTGMGVVFNSASNDNLGIILRVVPSVNGDRFRDVLVGANNAYKTTNAGATYLILGHNGTWPESTLLGNGPFSPGIYKIWGDPQNLKSGQSVAGCRDINGDGIGDFAIGTLEAKVVYVVFGRADGIWPSSLAELDGTNGFMVFGVGAQFGVTLDCGDINGDGLSDLAIGTRITPNGTTTVVFGRKGAWPQSVNTTGTSISGAEGFVAHGQGKAGVCVRFAGDINGDGTDDLVIGAPGYSATASNAGAAFVLFGHRSPWSSVVIDLGALDPETTGFAVYGGVASEAFGEYIANNPGNLDGDARGLSDIVIGAMSFNGYRGRAAVLYGTFWPFDCKTRDNTTFECSSCSGGFGLVGGICENCHPNTFSDGTGPCQSCVNGDCIECTVSGTCTKCREGFVPSGANMSCSMVRESSPQPEVFSSSDGPVHSSPAFHISSGHTQVTSTSVIIKFDPSDVNGVTTAEIANEIASSLGVPIELVTVAFVSNGEILVTINGANALVKADELVKIINSKDGSAIKGAILRKATDAHIDTGSNRNPTSTSPRIGFVGAICLVVAAIAMC